MQNATLLLKLFRDRNIFARTIYVRIIEMERYRYSALSIQLINKRALFDHLVLEHGQRADLWVTLLEAGRAVLYLIRHFTRSEHYPLRNALSPKAWINHCIPYARMYLTHVKSLYSWVHARTRFFFSPRLGGNEGIGTWEGEEEIRGEIWMKGARKIVVINDNKALFVFLRWC